MVTVVVVELDAQVQVHVERERESKIIRLADTRNIHFSSSSSSSREVRVLPAAIERDARGRHCERNTRNVELVSRHSTLGC